MATLFDTSPSNTAQYIQTLATQTNAKPLPAVEEVFGVRLPQDPADVLTSIDFDLIPNRPPPGVTLYDEEIEQVESSDEEEQQAYVPPPRHQEEEEEEDEDMEPAMPSEQAQYPPQTPSVYGESNTPFPVSAIATPADVEMFGTPGARVEGGEQEEDDGLFSGGEDDDDSDAMAEEVYNILLSYWPYILIAVPRSQMLFKRCANSKRKRITTSCIPHKYSNPKYSIFPPVKLSISVPHSSRA